MTIISIFRHHIRKCSLIVISLIKTYSSIRDSKFLLLYFDDEWLSLILKVMPSFFLPAFFYLDFR